MTPRSQPRGNSIQSLFWNSEQHRLRTVWRLGAILLLFLALTTVLDMVASSGGPVVLMTVLRQLLYLGGGLAILALLARWVDRRAFADYGFHIDRSWWVDLGFGLFLGAFLMSGIFLTELLAGWITVAGTLVTVSAVPFGVVFLISVLKYLAVGVSEELAFRGYLLKNLPEGLKGSRLGGRAAILCALLISSVVFGLGHLANQNATWVSTLNLILIGVLFSLPFLLTGELALSIGLHVTWNLFQGPVFGFAVSGGQPGYRWVSILQNGPAVWTGGAFGPEAGFVCLVWGLIGCALVAAWVRSRRKRLGLHLPLAEYAASAEQPVHLASSPAK